MEVPVVAEVLTMLTVELPSNQARQVVAMALMAVTVLHPQLEAVVVLQPRELMELLAMAVMVAMAAITEIFSEILTERMDTSPGVAEAHYITLLALVQVEMAVAVMEVTTAHKPRTLCLIPVAAVVAPNEILLVMQEMVDLVSF
jgi:hypothetical protein